MGILFQKVFLAGHNVGQVMIRVKSLDFNFSAKLSRTDYNESNKPIAHTGSEKLLVVLGVPKN